MASQEGSSAPRPPIPGRIEVRVCKNERASNRRTKHQVSKQTRCDGLMLCEGVATLKRNGEEFSLLVFVLGFIGFFVISMKLLI